MGSYLREINCSLPSQLENAWYHLLSHNRGKLMFHPVNCSSSGSLIIFNFPCTETKVKSAKSFVNLIFDIGFASISFLNELTIDKLSTFVVSFAREYSFSPKRCRVKE